VADGAAQNLRGSHDEAQIQANDRDQLDRPEACQSRASQATDACVVQAGGTARH
jgi:hypothetical protein